MKQAIQPFNPSQISASNMEIGVVSADIENRRAYWQVEFFDANGKSIGSLPVSICGAEYDAWGEDDSYILQITISKLGLTLAQ